MWTLCAHTRREILAPKVELMMGHSAVLSKDAHWSHNLAIMGQQ